NAIVRAFKKHLADHHLPEHVIAGYAMTFQHNEILLIKTLANRANQALDILKDCGALRADRHG
ncbi:MAG TPA: hypothetical protein VIT23_12290, partial [Terrimicrobiaceae bacterium]